MRLLVAEPVVVAVLVVEVVVVEIVAELFGSLKYV